MLHNTIHKVLMGEDMAKVQSKKIWQRERVRYERTHSDSVRHTDCKMLDDGWRSIAYVDDAPRFITGFGMFDAATGTHASGVLGKTMSDHGRPASVPTNRGPGSTPTSRNPRGGAGRNSKRSWSGRTYGTRRPASATRRPTANWSGPTGLQRRLPRFIAASHHKTVRGPPVGRVGDIFHPSGPQIRWPG